jgi:fructose-1,6-bisphosphatase II
MQKVPYYDLCHRVTELAAILAAMTRGHGSKAWTDYNAVWGMRSMLNELPIWGRFVSSEGMLDNAARFEFGEQIGADPDAELYDLAVDPIDGTSLCANGQDGSIAVLATAPAGSLLRAEETYMWKLACGPKAKGVISLDKSPTQNIRDVADALGKEPAQMTVAILDRKRHEKLIREVRQTGAMVKLLEAGDLMPAVTTAYDGRVDLLLGSGGGPEGVIAAAALDCLGGDFCGRLDKKLTETELERTLDFDVDESNLGLKDIVKKGVYAVCITAVTDSYFLEGVRWADNRVVTHTLSLRGGTSTMELSKKYRNISAHYWKKFFTPECQSLETYLKNV